jgi:hypothetical protein
MVRASCATLVLILASGLRGLAPCAAQSPRSAADLFQVDPGYSEAGALIEPIDAARLERAAFLASGVAPSGIEAYAAELDGALAPIQAELASTDSAGDQAAEAILGILHKSILRNYREDASTLDGILDTGFYNCVSSAVVYAIAAKEAGIPVAGVRTADHAFCTVHVGGRSVDVETTNPYGYDPGGKKEFKDSFGRVTGFAYVAPGGYGDRKAIGAGDLVGLILSNRASSLERSGRFAEAERLGADYAFLCPGPDSRSFLVDRIYNLVADMEARRDYDDAARVAEEAAAGLPGEARLAALVRKAEYNRAASLAQAGDWAGSFDAAAALAAAAPADAEAAALVGSSLSGLAELMAQKGDFAGARKAVAERAARAGPAAAAAAYAAVGETELVKAVNELPFSEAAPIADRIFAAGEVGASRYAQAIAAIYGNEAGRIGARGAWLEAAALADGGVAKLAAARIADDGSLARLARESRRNFVVEAHNSFAKLYNAGDLEGAKKALLTALAAMPGDPTLRRDLADMEAR